MDKTNSYYLLIDIGGTKLRAAIGNSNGKILQRVETFTHVDSEAKGALDAIFSLCDTVIKRSGINSKLIKKAGISFGGPVDYKNKRIIKSQHVQGWENFPLCDHITKRYGIPAIIDNDGNVAALGEYVYGNGKGCKSMIYLTVSTGVGGGLILNGEVWHGRNNLAGEIGHIIVEDNGRVCECGKKGCVEAYSSGYALGKNAQKYLLENAKKSSHIKEMVQGDIDKITAVTVYRAADDGDKIAQKMVDESIRYLGIAIANAICLLDVEKIVIGGGVTREHERFFGPLQKYIDSFSMFKDDYHVPVVEAKYGDDAGLKGAIALAIHAK